MKINLRPTRVEAFFFAILLQFLLFGLYFAHTNLEYFEAVFAVEDGLVEWLTVAWLLLSCGLCLTRFVKLRGKRPKLFLFMLLFFAAGFFFGAGEEVSWGQRIFEIKSSEFFMTHNSQGETNLHNLVVGGTKINKLLFGLILGIGIAFYCLVLPTLARKYPKIMDLVRKFAIPLPRGRQILAYVVIFILVQINPSPKRGELVEFGGTLMFFLMFLNPWNRSLFQLEDNRPRHQHHGQRRHHNNGRRHHGQRRHHRNNNRQRSEANHSE